MESAQKVLLFLASFTLTLIGGRMRQFSTHFVTTIFLLLFLPYTAFSDGAIRLKITTNHIPPSGVYDSKGHTWVWGIDGKSILQTSQTEFQLVPGTHKINYSTRSFSGGALSQSSNDLEFTVEDGHTYEVKLSNDNKPIVVDLDKTPR